MCEVDARLGGGIGEEAPVVGLPRGAGGGHDRTRGRLGRTLGRVAAGAIGDDFRSRGQVPRVETDGHDALVGDLAGQTEQEHGVLRDGLGEDLRRNRVWKALGIGGHAGRAHEGVPVEPEVSQRVAVEGLEGHSLVCG